MSLCICCAVQYPIEMQECYFYFCVLLSVLVIQLCFNIFLLTDVTLPWQLALIPEIYDSTNYWKSTGIIVDSSDCIMIWYWSCIKTDWGFVNGITYGFYICEWAFIFFPMLGVEPKALCRTYKHSTAELYPQQPFPTLLNWSWIFDPPASVPKD